MKWRLLGDWPVGAVLVPAGFVIDSDDLTSPHGTPIPLPPPLCAQALDQESYDYLCAFYGSDFLHLIQHAAAITPRTKAEMPTFLAQFQSKGKEE